MASQTSTFYDQGRKVKSPVGGAVVVSVQHTLTSALASTETLKVLRLPKGVRLRPVSCTVAAFGDPDSGNNATASLKYTDGTTTKTIIATGNLQAADTALAGTTSQNYSNDFHYTENDSYYVYLTCEANDVDTATVLGFEIAYDSV